MKIEDRVKKAVEYGLAGRPSDLGSWEALQRRARVDRRWRIAATALGTAAIISGALFAVPKLLDDRSTRPAPVTTSPTLPSPGSSTAVAAFDAIVAIDNGGAPQGDERIVVIDTATGQVRRELAHASGDGENLVSFGPSLALSPDGGTLYYVRHGPGPCRSSILSVPVAGGIPRKVVEGTYVAVSRDGRRLAYAELGTGIDCDRGGLVVRDLVTGGERRWGWAAEDPQDPYEKRGPQKLAWSSDGRHLAFDRDVGDPQDEVWVLDTTVGTTLLDASKITPERKEWSSPTYLGADRLAVIETIRSIHDPNGSSGRILIVDPDDARLLDILSPEMDGLVHIDSDDSGEHVVLATNSGRPRTDGLFRLSGGRLARVASGSFYAAAW